MSVEEDGKIEGFDKASKIYQIDRKGIVLQGMLSFFSSGTSTAFVATVVDSTPSTLAIVGIAVFMFQFTPKVLAEWIKEREATIREREAYRRAKRNKLQKKWGAFLLSLSYILESMSYLNTGEPVI